MARRRLWLALITTLVLAAGARDTAAQDKIKIGFLPGVIDPFYHVLESGVQAASKDLGVEIIVSPYPATWGVTAQTPVLDALIARGDIDYLITAPVSAEEMIAPLQAASETGIKIITVDTFLGDGDYAAGPVTFPISYIGTDNEEGGYTVGKAMAEKLGGKGKVYIQNTNQGVSSVDGAAWASARPSRSTRRWRSSTSSTASTTRPPRPSRRLRCSRPIPTSRASSASTCSAPRAPARRSPTPTWVAGRSRSRPMTRPRTPSSSCGTARSRWCLRRSPSTWATWAPPSPPPMHRASRASRRIVTTGFDIITLENVDDPEHSRFIYQ